MSSPSVELYLIRIVIIVVQGAANHVHNAQMYTNKFVAYERFLEGFVQGCTRSGTPI